jgi:spermidine/putrescine transport system substrate-binding protein
MEAAMIGRKLTGWVLAALAGWAPCALSATPDAQLAKELRLYNWDRYIDPQVLKDFEREFGVRVIEDKFASNEDLIAKIQASGGYDVIVPSDYTVQIMVRRELLAPLEARNLPNLKHIDARFRNPRYDPGNRYSVPYLWGTSGIGYSQKRAATVPATWDELFNPDKLKPRKGRVSMLNDMRETIGAALIYKGYSPNSTDPRELEIAKQVLLAQKPYLAKYDSEAYKESLAAGETVLAHGWSGEILARRDENPDVAFVVPREGSFLFVDNLAVPKSARSRYTAEVFINYLLRPEVAAKNSNYLRYPTPNAAAYALIDPKLEGAAYRVPAGVRFHAIEDIGEAARLYERVWTEVKAR